LWRDSVVNGPAWRRFDFLSLPIFSCVASDLYIFVPVQVFGNLCDFRAVFGLKSMDIEVLAF
jgi:hypothetical protein